MQKNPGIPSYTELNPLKAMRPHLVRKGHIIPAAVACVGIIGLFQAKAALEFWFLAACFLAAGVFKTVEEAQDKICPQYKIFQPEAAAKSVYDELYAFYSKIYFAFGGPQSAEFGNLLSGLIQLSEAARAGAAPYPGVYSSK